jgi:glycine/D-amino acid oxidase-like deaminating enzyme
MLDIALLPKNDGANGWSRVLPARVAKPPLRGDTRADWVVVGAGFAGLAAARRLAENRPGDSVALVEADEVGENASGRNSGFAIDVPHNARTEFDGLEDSRRQMRLARAAIGELEGQVTRHAIACDWSRAGKYHAAVSARGAKETLVPFARELEALGEPYRWLDGKAVAEEIGSPRFHAAVYTPGGALMNPAALTRGLADALPANVTLYEHTPVTAISYENGVTLKAAQGTLQAPRMILAVNGFAPEFGFFDGRLLRFSAHASLTRPLDDDEREALGGKDEWGLTPANAFVSTTMRFTKDRRILVRHGIYYRPCLRVSEAQRLAIRAAHEERLRQRFPMLPKVTIEYTWTGYVCLSRNKAPGFGRVAANVWTAVCQNGVGVTRGTASGMLAADLACGLDNPLIADLQAQGTPARLPPQPFLDWGARLRARFERLRHRHER